MSNKKIKIIVNGFAEEVPEGSSVSFLQKHFQEMDPHLLTEVNGRFVYPQDYNTTIINEGDKVEFINPNLGG